MECPNCQFQNIPGLRACARCQSLLNLAGVPVDPPRAAARMLPARVRHAGFRARLRVARTCGRSGRAANRLFHPDVDAEAVLSSVVPGLGHWRLGHRWFASLAMLVWLVLLSAAVYLRGGDGGWPAYFLLVGWHGFVVSLILTTPLRELPVHRRIRVGLVLYLILNFGIYLPAGYVISRFAATFPVRGMLSGNVLREGDVLLRTGAWNRPAQFSRGDLVVYWMRGGGVGDHTHMQSGYGIDRILAVPGDEVSFEPDGVRVNGVLLGDEQGPLMSMDVPRMAFDVPEGKYVILPSALWITFRGDPTVRDQLIERVCRVKAEDVRGRVFWRTRPWERFGGVRADDAGTKQMEGSP